MTKNQSCKSSGQTAKIFAKTGTYKIMKCTSTEPMHAKINQGLVHGGIWTSDPSSETALKASAIPMITKTVKDSVEAFHLPAVKYEQGALSKLRSK